MYKLLIIDDEENMLHMLSAMLKKSGFTVDTCISGEDGVLLLRSNTYDFVLCDVRMPGLSGLEFLKIAYKEYPELTVIMMSAYGSIDLAIEAMKAGAYDFISKPFKKDEVLLCLKKAGERERLRGENKRLKKEVARFKGDLSLDEMVQSSKAMKEVVALAAKAALVESTVLITGESGTGKEVLARGIHQISGRHKRPFFAINCGSIPAGLLESELFGHMKGAFTGATETKRGMFQEADKSTLLLDEIGELPVSMQVKLLRVLQEQEVKPVGTNSVKKIDVRIIAATSRDLEKEVGEERFRSDLFYRLNVIHVRVPPLRERQEDILPLAEHFIEKYNHQFKKNVRGISRESINSMMVYSWPGNVRELENSIQRAMVLSDTDELDNVVASSRLGIGGASEGDCDQTTYFCSDNLSIKKAQQKMEAYLIGAALKKTSGNKSNAAKLLEISYPSLLQKIKDYAL